MAKTVSGPSNFSGFSELMIQPIVTNGILINDIIDIADSFVIFDPSSIGDL